MFKVCMVRILVVLFNKLSGSSKDGYVSLAEIHTEMKENHHLNVIEAAKAAALKNQGTPSSFEAREVKGGVRVEITLPRNGLVFMLSVMLTHIQGEMNPSIPLDLAIGRAASRRLEAYGHIVRARAAIDAISGKSLFPGKALRSTQLSPAGS